MLEFGKSDKSKFLNINIAKLVSIDYSGFIFV